MKIYYSLGFYLDPHTGRGVGSYNKIKQLLALCDQFRSSSYLIKRKNGYLFNKLLNVTFLWFKDVFELLFQTCRFDVVILRDNLLFPIWIARMKGVLVCSEVHAVPWEELGQSKVKHFFVSLYRLRYLSLLKKSDGLIFNNPSLRDYFQESEGIYNPHLISYNGLSLFNDYPFVYAREESQRIYFVYAGNIYPWHGLELLIPIVSELSSKIEMTFFLVGDTGSSYARKVQAMFEELRDCKVVREASADVLLKYIRKADYCFLPTMDTRSSPGSPIKLFDYLAEGKRVITQKDCPGYSDVVESVGDGILVNFYEPETAVQKMISEGLSRSNSEIEQSIISKSKDMHSWRFRMLQWIKFFKTLKE